MILIQAGVVFPDNSIIHRKLYLPLKLEEFFRFFANFVPIVCFCFYRQASNSAFAFAISAIC